MKFNKSALTGSLVDGALGIGGAVVAQEIGTMIPASVDPMYVDIGKIVIGCLIPGFVSGKSHDMVKAAAIGFAAQGGLNLINEHLLKPAGFTRVGGADNSSYALAAAKMRGVDNSAYMLAKARMNGSVPQTRSTYGSGGV